MTSRTKLGFSKASPAKTYRFGSLKPMVVAQRRPGEKRLNRKTVLIVCSLRPKSHVIRLKPMVAARKRWRDERLSE